MTRVAALVAIVLIGLLGTGPLAVAAPAGSDASEPAPVRTDPVRDIAPGQQDAPAARLDVASTTPRVVTGTGPAELVVTGTVTNTGPVPIDRLGVRVQRGPALASEADVRTALDGEAATDETTPPFTDLGVLAPGGSVPFRYAVPLTGDPGRSLAIDRPGTYPLLVNVNGATGGDRSRLTAARMLLPVTGLPGGTRPSPPAASPFTMLYPISDAPRRIPPVPGQRPVLTDDELADSFAPGGRLRGLVDALATQAPTGSPVRTATCLAIDPELVATASSMRLGYDVITGPDGATVPGRGADAAGKWVDDLAAAARGSCVTALPTADADLVALVRGGQPELARDAVAQGRQRLTGDLGTAVLPGTVWPAGGVLDEPTLEALTGTSSVLLSADGLGGNSSRTAGVFPIAGAKAGTRAVIVDPLLTGAASGPDAADGAEALAGHQGPLSSQDLIGALGFRAGQGPAPGPLVVAPPHSWTADGGSASALLSAAGTLIGEGLLAPTGLGTLTSTGPVTDPERARLYYPVQAGSREIPSSVVASVGAQGSSINELRAAAEGRTGVGATPDQVFDPLRLGTLRAVSASWRGRPDLAERNATVVADRIEQLRGSVRVLEPPSPYSLGTTDAPLLLTIANGLPVTMNVRVVLSSTAGLRVAPIPAQAIPPLGRIQIRVSAKVTRSGQFSVDAGLRTPDGAVLGPDTRLRVRSTAYGTITVWITAVAGAVLVLLVVRRVLRRIRPGGGSSGTSSGPSGRGPNGPDPDRPPPGPPDRQRGRTPPVAPGPGRTGPVRPSTDSPTAPTSGRAPEPPGTSRPGTGRPADPVTRPTGARPGERYPERPIPEGTRPAGLPGGPAPAPAWRRARPQRPPRPPGPRDRT